MKKENLGFLFIKKDSKYMCQAAVFQDLKICVEKNVSLFGAKAFGAEFSGYFSLSPHAKKKSGGFFVPSHTTFSPKEGGGDEGKGGGGFFAD